MANEEGFSLVAVALQVVLLIGHFLFPVLFQVGPIFKGIRPTALHGFGFQSCEWISSGLAD